MHWHAFTYTGQERPKDSEARNPQSATPPNTISMWFRKPRTMMAATFTDAEAAHAWLGRELTGSPPPETAISVPVHLGKARECLERKDDAYVGYYTATGRFLVRAVLVCPHTREHCPDPPT